MKPLIILLLVTFFTMGYYKITQENFNVAASARTGMAVMLVFTALGHYLYAEGMTMMLPKAIPFKKEIVYITGVIEIVSAIGLLIPKYQNFTAWLLIVFFILIIPANINGAIQQIDYQKATFDGKGLSYLFFRIPLQLFFIAWVYFSALKS